MESLWAPGDPVYAKVFEMHIKLVLCHMGYYELNKVKYVKTHYKTAEQLRTKRLYRIE